METIEFISVEIASDVFFVATREVGLLVDVISAALAGRRVFQLNSDAASITVLIRSQWCFF